MLTTSTSARRCRPPDAVGRSASMTVNRMGSRWAVIGRACSTSSIVSGIEKIDVIDAARKRHLLKSSFWQGETGGRGPSLVDRPRLRLLDACGRRTFEEQTQLG